MQPEAATPRPYPFSEPQRLDMDPTYRELREHEPVSRVRLPYGREAWLVTRHADVQAIRSDARFSSVPRPDSPTTQPMPPASSGALPLLDPPQHTRLRRLVAKAFTARRVQSLRPRARQLAEELAERMREAGPPAELVADFAVPLPVAVICELLGVPPADQADFVVWSEAFFTTTALTQQQIRDHRGRLRGYLAELVAQRRLRPADDLLGALVQARDDDGALAEDELIGLAELLLVAGHESTATQLANFVYVLLEHPGQLEWLRADQARIPAAVEELLRYVPLIASVFFARHATTEVEIGGTLIRPGEPVVMSLPSANRDERAFDQPEVLRLDRAPNPHLAFGHGIHHCLGAGLARLELQEALGALLRTFPRFWLAAGRDGLAWRTGSLTRGLWSLPVSWCPAAENADPYK